MKTTILGVIALLGLYVVAEGRMVDVPQTQTEDWVTALVDFDYSEAPLGVGRESSYQRNSTDALSRSGGVVLASRSTEHAIATVLVRFRREDLPRVTALPNVDLVIVEGVDDYAGRIPDAINIAFQVDGLDSARRLRAGLSRSGSVLTYQSQAGHLLMADVPLSRVGELVTGPEVEAFQFDRPGGPSMRDVNITLGNNPFYWPYIPGATAWYAVVIDSGLYLNSPAFNGSKIAGQWGRCRTVSWMGCADGADADSDRSSYEYGWGSSEPIGGDTAYNRHGTLMAAALGANSYISQNRGVAASLALKIIPYRVDFRSNSVLAALEEIATHVENTGADPRIAVVNYSGHIVGVVPQQGDCDGLRPLFDHALQRLFNAGVPVVAAAGNLNPGEDPDNETRIDFPACTSTVISVGASTDEDEPVIVIPEDPARFWASQTDTTLDLFAPGLNVVSAHLPFHAGDDIGTSLSSAIAAGIFAKLKARHPNESPASLLTRVRQSCPKIWDQRVGAFITRVCLP